MKGYLCVNKPRGVTPLQLIHQIKKKSLFHSSTKISYAGRLDPMAEGLLILLIDEENKKRQKYEDLEKEYIFDVLFGISTDTYDVMGKIETISSPPPLTTLQQHLEKLLPLYLGKREQPYPPYSSFHVKGKPLFYWARENRLHEIAIPHKIITIDSFALLSAKEILKEKLVSEVVKDITHVSGDFRQQEILSLWKALHSKPTLTHFPLIRFQVTCTSGTYVRSLAEDLGQKIGCSALAYRIIRTRVGSFTLEKAVQPATS